MHVMLCAFEPSGDALGATLMAALRARRPETEFSGCGGAQMAREGLASLFPIDPFSIIGPGGAFSAVPAALSAIGRLQAAARERQPDAMILIDSWTLSKAAAAKLKKAAPNAALIKYVAPQVWASRPKRAKIAAALFDGLLCLFDFELKYFLAEGAKAVAVGHPGFQAALSRTANGARFRAEFNIGDAPLLAVAPGSRKGELRRLADPFRDAAARMVAEVPDARIAIAAAPSVEKLLPQWLAAWPRAPLVVPRPLHDDLYAAANAALAASGTVVTEIAARGAPVAVGYKVDPLTEIWARHVLTTPYVSLPNIAAGREIVPEFLQQRCTGPALAGALAPYLQGKAALDADALRRVVRRLAGEGPPAAEAAADAVLAWIGERRR